MYHMRPGTRIPSGQKSYKNRPEVTPPISLRFFAAFTLFTIIGFLIFAVADHLSMVGGRRFDPAAAALVVGLHFALPFAILYTVSTNSPLSRPAIALYTAGLCTATAAGAGMLGRVPVSDAVRIGTSVTVAVIVAAWLFGSPRMRLYYALVAHKPVPPELLARADELLEPPQVARRLAAGIDWLAGYMEIAVLIGFIVLAFLAYASTA